MVHNNVLTNSVYDLFECWKNDFYYNYSYSYGQSSNSTSKIEPVLPVGKVLVIKVHDGDTIVVVSKDKKYNVRLLGIDAPELSQKPYGKEAKDFLSKLVLGKYVSLEYEKIKIDIYGRLLAYVVTDNKVVINCEMVKEGMAISYLIRKYFIYYNEFQMTSYYAKTKKKGIFYREGQDNLKVIPEEYRRQRRNRG